MKIKWLGHACFVISSEQGIKVLTDPYSRDAKLNYPEIKDSVDIVTVSHDHYDHNAVSSVPGDPTVLKGSIQMTIKDINVKTLNSFHDTVKGKERGINHIFCITVDKINICHLGDLGHPLDPEEILQLGKVDVLLIPVGGVFTIDVDGANQVYQDIKPHIAIPMHYKTDRCKWLTFSADDFAKNKTNVKMLNSSEIELTANDLAHRKEIVVLKYAS
jgi:L-ascorbate metabolism protein UlaG (beta-lactamase superfamily)